MLGTEDQDDAISKRSSILHPTDMHTAYEHSHPFCSAKTCCERHKQHTSATMQADFSPVLGTPPSLSTCSSLMVKLWEQRGRWGWVRRMGRGGEGECAAEGEARAGLMGNGDEEENGQIKHT